MSAADRAKAWESLLERLRRQYAPDAGETPEGGEASVPGGGPWGEDPVLREFILSFLCWDCPAARAAAGMTALSAAFVDLNELRVSLVEEIVGVLGRNYPRATERCFRLRAALNDIYKKEHAVRLLHLAEKSKRDAKAYLEGIVEAPGYVTARVFLVALGGHAVPVDERTAERLAGSGIVEEGATPEIAAATVEKLVKAGEGLEAHQLLQAWADDPEAKATRGARPARAARPAARKGKARPTASGAKRSPARRATRDRT